MKDHIIDASKCEAYNGRKIDRCFDRNGDEIHIGDYVTVDGTDEPSLVCCFLHEDSHTLYGMGYDATNPSWVKSGNARAGSEGVYPFTEYSLANSVELVK